MGAECGFCRDARDGHPMSKDDFPALVGKRLSRWFFWQKTVERSLPRRLIALRESLASRRLRSVIEAGRAGRIVELSIRVRDNLSLLSREQRDVIELLVLQEPRVSLQEASESLGMNVTDVRQHLRSALHTLTQHIQA